MPKFKESTEAILTNPELQASLQIDEVKMPDFDFATILQTRLRQRGIFKDTRYQSRFLRRTRGTVKPEPERIEMDVYLPKWVENPD